MQDTVTIVLPQKGKTCILEPMVLATCQWLGSQKHLDTQYKVILGQKKRHKQKKNQFPPKCMYAPKKEFTASQ